MNTGIGGHQTSVGNSQTWFTPKEIVTSLGEFDLDPCSHVNRPWDTAKEHYTIEDNGLILPWSGRVWLNPPYDRYVIESFLKKMADHGNGISLIFARTETQPFQKWVFPYAESILFINGRLTFIDEFGIKGKANSGAPSVLISYSEYDSLMIEQSGINGKHVLVNSVPVIIVKESPSWKNVVSICLLRLNGEAKLKDIYSMAEVVAGDKTQKNKHFKEKIRQQLQKHFERVNTGQYKLIA
ncbi:DNA N-6-adenine-methyltransferase [Sphingobacterium faecium]